MRNHVTEKEVLDCTTLAQYPWLAKWHSEYRIEADTLLADAQARNALGQINKTLADGIRKKLGTLFYIMRVIERQANQIGGPTLKSKENARIEQLIRENENLRKRLERYEQREIIA